MPIYKPSPKSEVFVSVRNMLSANLVPGQRVELDDIGSIELEAEDRLLLAGRGFVGYTEECIYPRAWGLVKLDLVMGGNR